MQLQGTTEKEAAGWVCWPPGRHSLPLKQPAKQTAPVLIQKPTGRNTKTNIIRTRATKSHKHQIVTTKIREVALRNSDHEDKEAHRQVPDATRHNKSSQPYLVLSRGTDGDRAAAWQHRRAQGTGALARGQGTYGCGVQAVQHCDCHCGT